MLKPYTLNIQESLKHAKHLGIGFLRYLASKMLMTIIPSWDHVLLIE